MISAASRVTFFLRDNPNATDEDVFQDLLNYILKERIRDKDMIRYMIASATRAINLKRKNLNSFDKQSEKQILKQVIGEIPGLAEEINDY